MNHGGSPQASWSAGGHRERVWHNEKKILLTVPGLFTITILRTVNRRIPVVTIPLPQSLFW